MAKKINIAPGARLLSVIGRIPLAGWQCIAELIDNSIDAMIVKKKLDSKEKNEIRIDLPSSGEIDNNIPLIISDNGSGMTERQLQLAVSAGISGKLSVEELGLFGVGFNIATARLSKKVTVWTSTIDSNQDIGVTIDIPEMIRKGKRGFDRDLLIRKNSETSPKGKHGTSIVLNEYTDIAKNLLNRPDLIRNLNNVYSDVIKEKYNIDIQAKSNRGWVQINPKKFCIWDENRTVNHNKYGEIKPLIKFEHEISKKPFCTKCIIELHFNEVDSKSLCPECHSSDSIIEKKYNISGWVGIQRFFSLDNFGIDIIRNGRIIKESDKSMFTWYDRKNIHEPLFEYPIDNPGLGGRIVGEIHADFIVPEFTKDNFPVTEEWIDAVEFVRGTKPMQPNWATKKLKLGGINKSVLAMLFYGFRKTEPGRKNLVCGVENGGANAGNKRSLEYSRKFYNGDEEFQSDEKWYELVMLAEEGEDVGGPGLPSPEDPPEDPPSTEDQNPYPGIISPLMDITFDIERKIDVPPITAKIYEYTPIGSLEFNPVIFDPESANVYHVKLNQQHEMIKDFEEGWQDLVMMEIAERFHSNLFNTDEWPISKIYYELKLKYFPERVLNIDKIVTSAKNLMRDLHNYLINESIKMVPKPNLNPTLLTKLKKEYRDIENKNLTKPSLILETSSYVKYLDIKYLHDFIRDYPKLIFDNKFLKLSYKEFDDDPEYQSTLLDDYFSYFANIAWITDILSDMNDAKRKKYKSKIISSKLALEFLLESRV